VIDCPGCVELPVPTADDLAILLRAARSADLDAIVAIRSTPEIHHRWGGDDLAQEFLDDLASEELHLMIIEVEGQPAGAIQWSEEVDPMYRHAGIDLYLDPTMHGRGIGSAAVAALARHLFDEHGHHRLVIDPATDNLAAIDCYSRVGFRPVGVMRQYELGADGTWHDGLLMELLGADFRPPPPTPKQD